MSYVTSSEAERFLSVLCHLERSREVSICLMLPQAKSRGLHLSYVTSSEVERSLSVLCHLERSREVSIRLMSPRAKSRGPYPSLNYLNTSPIHYCFLLQKIAYLSIRYFYICLTLFLTLRQWDCYLVCR